MRRINVKAKVVSSTEVSSLHICEQLSIKTIFHACAAINHFYVGALSRFRLLQESISEEPTGVPPRIIIKNNRHFYYRRIITDGAEQWRVI